VATLPLQVVSSLEVSEHKLQPQTQISSRKKPVAIVGGSAAGLYTAALLARDGVAVQVYEGSQTLDPASRALIVTHRMRELLGEAAEASIVNEIRRFELFTDGRAASIELNQPDLIIQRATLVKSLAAMAQSAGAKINFGRKFQGFRPGPSGMSMEFTRVADGVREEVAADTVVGGDGSTSRVAHSGGWPPQETVPLIQAIVPLPKDMSPETVRVWFVPQDTPYFYWLIPESKTHGALGLIGVSGAETRLHLETFMRKRNFEPVGFQGARIPLYRRWIPVRRDFGGGEIYLVGDAAGQVKVTTVGGIVTGFRGALGVAKSILNKKQSPELKSLRRELNTHLLLRKSLHHFQQADYSRLVDLLNDSARRSLGQYSRDDAMSVLWHICKSQPRLVLMGLRGLLTRGRAARQDVSR
jgi:flavin-dependent dehydrogenase